MSKFTPSIALFLGLCIFHISGTQASDSVLPQAASRTLEVAAAVQPKHKQHILIINSYNQGYDWTDNEVQGIEDGLADQKGITIHIEYMDTKMSNDARYFDMLADIFAHKYQKVRFDVIITTDDDALNFMRRYQPRLFPDVPLVFAGVNNVNDSKLTGFSHYTGVNEADDFSANLDLLLQLYPDTKDLFVINDTLTNGLNLQQTFERTADAYRDRLRFHYLIDMSMSELKSRLAELPEDSLAFYLSFFRDGTGTAFTPGEAIPQISAASSVPLFGAVDYMIGKGIVGGMVKNSYFQGETAARLTKRVLAGTAAEEIPVVMQSPNQLMFDYQQLMRFNIPLRSLPAGSKLVNEPQTFYYKYKVIIWTTLAIIGLLLLFILVLLLNIQKRKRAQRGLQNILESMSSLFEFDTIDRFKNDMWTKLAAFLPITKDASSPMTVYRYRCKEGSPLSEAEVLPLHGNGSHDEIPIQTKELLLESLSGSRCVVRKRQGVVLLKSPSIPGNLIYFEGNREFDAMDRDLLEIFATNLSMAIDQLEKQKIEESLETARKIQLSMLPQSFSSISDHFEVDLHARLMPAKEVGGDLYDFFPIDEQHLGFTVGDVSGKGVPAALFMAMAKTLVRSAAEQNQDPARILEKVNDILARDNDEAMFVTLFFAILNRENGELRFANGGHNPPYLVHPDGSVERLDVIPGIAVGVMEEIPFTTQSTTLEPGSAILVYSDGVTEAMDPSNQEFGEERLQAFLGQWGGAPASQVTEKLLAEVKGFANGAPQSDDITMLCLRNRIQA